MLKSPRKFTTYIEYVVICQNTVAKAIDTLFRLDVLQLHTIEVDNLKHFFQKVQILACVIIALFFNVVCTHKQNT